MHTPERSFSAAALVREARELPTSRKVQFGCIIAACLVLFALVLLAGDRNTFVIDYRSDAKGSLQVYFDQGGGFSEQLSVRRPHRAGANRLRFPMPPGEVVAVRIDPDAIAGHIVIERLAVDGTRSRTRSIGSPHDLQIANQMQLAPDLNPGLITFAPSEGAYDPQLYLPLATPVTSAHVLSPTQWRLLWGLFWTLTAVVTLIHFARRAPPTRALAVAAAAMIGLLATLAISDYSVNPDEALHEVDAHYFKSHWAPPALDDPALTGNFQTSPYGVSYLAEWNVVYLVAGKSAQLLASLGTDERTTYRLVNVSLFLLMIAALAAIRAPPGAYLILLVTPQLWYLFSYFNGDALPFATGLIAATLVLMPQGRLVPLLRGEAPLDLRTAGHVLLFCACLGLMLISKKNYWPVVAFIVLSLSARTLDLRAPVAAALATLLVLVVADMAAGSALAAAYGAAIIVPAILAGLVAMGVCAHAAIALLRQHHGRKRVLRLASTLGLALLVAAPWIVIDQARNQGKAETVLLLRETHAGGMFKPSHPLEETYAGLRKYEKGHTLPQLLSPPLSWGDTSYRSFLGAYGYMEYFNSSTHNRLATALLMILLACGLVIGRATGTLSGAQIFICIGSVAAMLGASLLHSWTYDFQPQGRYVLGILIILLPLALVPLRATRLKVLYTALAIGFFALSAWSLIFVALPNLT